MSISPTLAAMQQNEFPIGGESSIAVDLVGTLVAARTSPKDLLIEKAAAWWDLEAVRGGDRGPDEQRRR